MHEVALDATLWDEPTTGIGLYTRELAGALGRLGWKVAPLGAATTGQHPRGKRGRTAFTLLGLPAALRADDTRLYHALGNFNLPLRKPAGTRFVLTVHDVIPQLFPETVSRKFRWQFELWLRQSLRLADAVVCVSETTRRDLQQLHPSIPNEKLFVALNGVDHVLAQPSLSDAELSKLELPPKYVLFAGSWDVRKNLQLVLSAWERIPTAERVPLVIAGQSWFGAEAAQKRVAGMKASGLDVRPLGYVSAPALATLMKRATVFAFPSRYEGFGLPPLEAMRLGTATVISTEGALPEVCGDGVWKVGPDDAAALTQALRRLLGNESERAALASAGEQWASAFTWERAARATIRAYEHAVSA